MNNTPTPRTDNVVASDMGDSGFLVDMINHAQQLEQELNEVKEYAAGQRVLASAINDAATEMVKERDQLRKVVDELALAIHTGNEHGYGLRIGDRAIELYDQLPHVIERKTK